MTQRERESERVMERESVRGGRDGEKTSKFLYIVCLYPTLPPSSGHTHTPIAGKQSRRKKRAKSTVCRPTPCSACLLSHHLSNRVARVRGACSSFFQAFLS